MHTGKMLRSIAVVGAFSLLISGCSLFGEGTKEAIDPPPVGSIEETIGNQPLDGTTPTTGSVGTNGTGNVGNGNSGLSGSGNKDTARPESNQGSAGAKTGTDAKGASSTSGGDTKTVQNLEARTIYAKDANGFVVPVTLQLPKTNGLAQTTLDYMVAGGPGEALLPKGFKSLLPKGTKSVVSMKDKSAIVDFNKEFLQYELADERKLLEGIVWGLTSVPNVESVQIKVEGKALTEMPKDHLPVEAKLTRTMGINIEVDADADYGRKSTPVTLYYMNDNQSGYTYFVPVTRLIRRTNDVGQAVLQQLIKGPFQKSGLQRTVQASTRILNLKPSGDLVTVNLSDGLLNASGQAPGESLQSVVLSLTENLGVSKVQILVDDKLTFQSTDKLNYSQPVTKPNYLNPIKM